MQRICNSDGRWEVPDVSDCQEYMYSLEEIQAEASLQIYICRFAFMFPIQMSAHVLIHCHSRWSYNCPLQRAQWCWQVAD